MRDIRREVYTGSFNIIFFFCTIALIFCVKTAPCANLMRNAMYKNPAKTDLYTSPMLCYRTL